MRLGDLRVVSHIVTIEGGFWAAREWREFYGLMRQTTELICEPGDFLYLIDIMFLDDEAIWLTMTSSGLWWVHDASLEWGTWDENA